MGHIIYVINASSRCDTGITDDLIRSLDWVKGDNLPEIRCVTLQDGPDGITTARDSDDAAPAVLRFIEYEADKQTTAGFVIACFSDPGVYGARELTLKPVVGIGEAGFLSALSLGEMIGTIGVSAGNGAKSMRLARHIGISSRIAGHYGLGLDYAQLQDSHVATTRIIDAGKSLRDDAGASVLLFAGAGLARYVEPLQQAVGLPVIDPTQAAVGTVLTQIMQKNYLTSI